MIVTILGLGFVIGLQHAFEADHLAAVSALIAQDGSKGKFPYALARQGALWGLGHTIALLLITAAVLFTPFELGAEHALTLERLVGVMLIVLGVRVIFRLVQDRVHVHVHQHRDGTRHFHAHSHRHDTEDHGQSRHDHAHPGQPGRAAALVGLAHGAAGSAAMLVLVAAAFESPIGGMLYVLVFGLGSILGMTALTAVMSVPLAATAQNLTWANNTLLIAVGLVSIAVGVQLVAGIGLGPIG